MLIINVTRSSMPTYEEYCEEIKELWESRWLTNNGIKHKQLEENLKEYLGASDITLFTNGHLALEAALSAMKLEGEVITTPYTFISTTNAITRVGLQPAFCDINPDDYTIDASKIEALITPKTCAIVPVHVYGNICDCKAIEQIAEKYSLKVIYDAAHAFGEKVDGQDVSSFGDASMFSFHATKVFHTVEGGAVVYRDEQLSQMLDAYKNFGMISPEEIVVPGGNAKMSEFHAAMGICNLRHIDEEISKRKLVVQQYRKLLSDIKGIKLCKEQENVKSNYAYFSVVFDGYKYTRDEILDRLAEHNIAARKYFYPLTNECACYGFNGNATPVAKYISENVLTLPLYADLSIDDVERICDIILE